MQIRDADAAKGSDQKVPGFKSVENTDMLVSMEDELPVGLVLCDGMKEIAQCVSALASISLDDCMKYIIKSQGCDLSQPCDRRLFMDSTFQALEGKRCYV